MQRLKVSRKTIYKYFLSKEDIFRAIIDEAYDDIHIKQKIIFNDETLSLKEKMYGVCTIETKYDKKIRLDKIYESEQLLPDIFQYFMGKYEKGWEIVEELLQQGVDDGIFQEVSIGIVINLLQNGMKMICHGNFLSGNNLTYQKALEQIVTIIIKGISK